MNIKGDRFTPILIKNNFLKVSGILKFDNNQPNNFISMFFNELKVFAVVILNKRDTLFCFTIKKKIIAVSIHEKNKKNNLHYFFTFINMTKK